MANLRWLCDRCAKTQELTVKAHRYAYGQKDLANKNRGLLGATKIRDLCDECHMNIERHFGPLPQPAEERRR